MSTKHTLCPTSARVASMAILGTWDALGRKTRLLQDGPTQVTYTFDDNGIMTLENRVGALLTYTYDREERLSVRNESGGVSTYTYDGMVFEGARKSRADRFRR